MKKLSPLLLFAISILIFSCRDDEVPEIPDTDLIVFDKLNQLAHEAEILWPGYDYLRTKPAYIILRNDDGTSPRGYLLNPINPIPSGSVKLSAGQSIGLNLYSNDKFISDANEVLGEDGLFDFGDLFFIHGTPYFLFRSKVKQQYSFYDEFKNVGDNWVSLVLFHEMFHTFQIHEWTYPVGGTQDFLGYPLTPEVMIYELALFDLMKTTAHVQGAEVAKDVLRKYIVLFEKLASVDPTPNKLVLNTGRFEQWLEGSARYVEHYSAFQSIYPSIANDPSHAWGSYLDKINSGELIRSIFVKRAWYHIGASAIHLLKEAGIPVHNRMREGNTPYDLAVELLVLTGEEKDVIHTQMVSALGWNAYVLKATYLHSLL